jgi:LysM repeat protein
MRKAAPLVLLLLTLLPPVGAQGVSQNIGGQVAGLREDVRILVQRVGELTLRVEQLERENARLLRATEGLDGTYATVAQLNEAVAELSQAIATGDSTSQAKAASAIQELAKQTNAAVDSVAKGMAARPAITTPDFTDDFPKQGLSYTVQKGDTLSSIAARFKTTVRHIQNANRIVDPTKIQVGQTLFIPGGQ